MWKKIGDPVDGAPLYIGVQTFLKQFHPDITTQYFEYLGQYMKSIISNCTKYVYIFLNIQTLYKNKHDYEKEKKISQLIHIQIDLKLSGRYSFLN